MITFDEAESRYDFTYHFEMSSFDGKRPKFVVDSTFYGNEARFVNHSCSPNMAVRTGMRSLLRVVIFLHPRRPRSLESNFLALIEYKDFNFQRIAFFAAKDIEKGEELTINYFNDAQSPEPEDKSIRMNGLPCL